MKRLQFRHHNEVFATRDLALTFFKDIVDTEKLASQNFGTSLYAEPMVAKYLDESGKEQILFAIGVDSGNTEYHIIDSAKLIEDIKSNKDAIEAEVLRATEAEAVLTDAIEAEEERAKGIENDLQGQITDNISTVKKCAHDLDANVLEEYVLQNAKGVDMGEHIKIYKDSALVDAQMASKGVTGVTFDGDKYELHYDVAEYDVDHEYLYLIYKDANNDIKFVSIDFEKFVMEAEFGDGLVVAEGTHIVKIKLNEGVEESYLKVNENGLYTEGIDNAIAEASASTLEEANAYAVEKKNEAIATASAYTDAKIAEEHTCHTEADAVVLEEAKEYTDEAEARLQKQVDQNKVYSKDIQVLETASGTELTFFADEVTITKENNVLYDDGLPRLQSLLKISEVTPSNASIKAQYILCGKDGKQIGAPIQIAKESSLSSVGIGKLGDTINSANGNIESNGTGNDTLNFIYLKADGTYELVAIEISKYFTDAHFGKGLSNQDGVVSLNAGDGNEYLVIGDDTISVKGVDASINSAKEEVKTFAEDKANDALDTSKAYTDGRITDVTSSIDNLTNTINTAVDGMNETLNNSIAIVNNSLTEEISERSNADNALDAKITANTEAITNEATRATAKETEINESVAHLSASTKSLIEGVNINIDSVSSATKALIAKIESDMADAEGVKVIDVVYGADDTRPTYVQLKLADGTYTTGFDASDFLVDGVLSSVDFIDGNLEFVWNDDDNTKFSVPISSLSKIYTSADDRYIKVNDTVISAVVDGEGGLVKTLASTEYVNSKIDDVTTIANEAEAKATTLDAKVNAVSGSIVTELNGVKTALEGADTQIATQVSANTEAIRVLNADALTTGSMSYIANDKIAHAIITDGVLLTEVDASHSLAKMVDGFSGITKYYISSKATDMYYVKEDGTVVNLNEYIKGLEAKIDTLNNEFEDKVKAVIDAYLVGKEHEIKIEGGVVGFSDDAIFGED